MPYYPLSQISTNLQTDGTEYQTSDGTPYIGFYYKISTGKIYTGKSPQSGNNIELFPLTINDSPTNESLSSNPKTQIIEAFPFGDSDPNINPIYQETYNVYAEYSSLSPTQKTVYKPYFNPNYPTDEDYTIGEFRRYFCKRANDIIYLEIDKVQYDLIVNKDISIMFAMYVPFVLPWNISGDKDKVATTNKNIVELTAFKNRLPKLGDYLKHNYIKYYK